MEEGDLLGLHVLEERQAKVPRDALLQQLPQVPGAVPGSALHRDRAQDEQNHHAEALARAAGAEQAPDHRAYEPFDRG